jgi:hypothetical protein
VTPSRPSSRRRISPATTWLIRAFSPGCPTLLRYWVSSRSDDGDLLTIFFDLPDDPAMERAGELAASAGTLRLIRIGRTIVRDLTAEVCGDQRTLKVDALLGVDSTPGEPQ